MDEFDPAKTNFFGSGVDNPGADETGEIDHFTSTSSRRGSEDITNPYHDRLTRGETSFIENINDTTPLIRREKESDLEKAERKQNEAWGKLRENIRILIHLNHHSQLRWMNLRG